MNTAFYSSATGMIYTQQGLDIIANNMANTQTVGYKSLRPSFSDVLYTIPREQTPDVQEGHGAYITKTDLMLTMGTLERTSSMLDFALPNEGFFAVADGQGNISYTRNGAFTISQIGEQWELVDASGRFVLDYEGNHIIVPFEELSENIIDYTALTKNVGVFTFDNPYGLEAGGENTYLQTLSSGEATAAPLLDKLAGALERSNVDIATEMIKALEAQRSYQLNARILQTADEFQRIANTLR
ncbi:MAG TPA: flagellar hook-basal body protein [Oscillospiraceae bacterium]|nr:flagellar hook-basal body protein [Oscillospiraceae bacterium]